MANHWRAVAAGAISAMVCALQGNQAAAQTKPLQVMVFIRDLADLSPTAIRRAEAVAGEIYRQIGVDTTWLDAAQFMQEMPSDPENQAVYSQSVMRVTLLSAALERQHRLTSRALGFARLSSQSAWVFVQRVQDVVAGDRLQDEANLLGHVIAHEIGHLILRVNSHSAVGLMRADLDLRLAAQNLLRLTPEEAKLIRAELTCKPTTAAAAR